MARKRSKVEEAVAGSPPPEVVGDDPAADLQRPPAEALYAEELARLAEADAGRPRPSGWRLIMNIEHAGRRLDGLEVARTAVAAWKQVLSGWGLV